MPSAREAPDRRRDRRQWAYAALAGATVGLLSGLIGLGGAELRLPLLVAVFGFAALQAVILNKALSLASVRGRAGGP